MLPLNRSSLAFLSISTLILLAGCETTQPTKANQKAQPTNQPSTGGASTPIHLAAQNRAAVSMHTQFIPISPESITTLTTQQTHAMEVGRAASTFPDAEYWLAFGADTWHKDSQGNPAPIASVIDFDTQDKGKGELEVATLEVMSGWTITIRPAQFPRQRTKRISSGGGVKFKHGVVASLALVPDKPTTNSPDRTENTPKTVTGPTPDPLKPEILLYRYVPSDIKASKQDWVLYRPVRDAAATIDFEGYDKDGKPPSKPTITLNPGYWAVYDFSLDEWIQNAPIPSPPQPSDSTYNDPIHQLLRHVESETGRSFYPGGDGNSGSSSSSDPTNPSDSAAK